MIGLLDWFVWFNCGFGLSWVLLVWLFELVFRVCLMWFWVCGALIDLCLIVVFGNFTTILDWLFVNDCYYLVVVGTFILY